jgi:hypothetical protein
MTSNASAACLAGTVRPGPTVLAGVVTLAGILAACARLPLYALAHQSVLTNSGHIPEAVVFGGVGFLVARRQPRNPVGWSLLAGITIFAASSDAALWVTLAHLPSSRWRWVSWAPTALGIAIAARLQDATDPDEVRSVFIGTVGHVLEPAHLSLWLAGGPR